MKAVVLKRYGGLDALELKDLPTPRPNAGQVLVRVHASSINDWDWEVIRGRSLVVRMLHGLFTPKVPIIGCDIAGRVEAVGEGVKRLRVGDEVYGDLCMQGFGAFAELACASEAELALKPAGMTFEQAAAIPQAGMLAVQGLIDVGKIQPGQKVLLNGAGGGVGTFALQIAKRLYDADVTVVDRADKLDALRALGADRVVDYREEDFTRSGGPYDLILDVKTNRSPFAYARALKPEGIYATVGGNIPRLIQTAIVGPLISRLSNRHVRVVGLKPNKDLLYMNGLFEAGQLAPVIDRHYTLADIADAFRRFGAADHKGKIVITL
ncbi:MAG TPA: NAD(P)-dependent alcohol dehydrogenase [Vicinamibacterales bacterium]|nr:NAD(P)-dependent alcohol dehydrogenase [Vicinamibacterales bacterium]